jgi:hypothetical protein
MPDAVKGGLFVGAAVVTGIVAGLLLAPSFGDEGRGGNRPRVQESLLPTMPSVVGEPLDEARDELRRRGIGYVTDAPEIVEAVAPGILEVCESEPGPGRSIRGNARLHTAFTGTCDI